MERYNITVKDNPFDGCPYADMVVSDDGAYVRYDDAQRALDAEREANRLGRRQIEAVDLERQELQRDLTTLQAQLNQLATFITVHVPGEPSPTKGSLGAVDCAIHIIINLQAQLRQVEEALQERKEFIADCDTALDRIQAPRTNEGQEELVSTWRRIELLGKLLYQYRQELERSAPTLRAENARLREVLEAIADGPGTNGYCTQYERYMVELAQAALQPERGKP